MILKFGGNRLKEKLLEGPPTEDSIIDIEKEEVEKEGDICLTFYPPFRQMFNSPRSWYVKTKAYW